MNTLKDTGSRTQPSDNVPTEQWKPAPSLVSDSSGVENVLGASKDGDINLDSSLVISDLELANLRGEYFDWDDQDVDFANFLNPQTTDGTAQNPLPESLIRHSTPSTNRTTHPQQASSFPNVSIPTFPTQAVRSLVRRPKLKTGTQGIVNLILHTLKSYPLMMLRRNALPPFIHPRLISSNVENNYMEPLTNCISLMHMISSGVQGSRKLFWKNVRLECERLREDVCWDPIVLQGIHKKLMGKCSF